MKEKHVKQIPKIAVIISLTVLATLLLIYLGLAIYFIGHFYWGTKINELSVGGQSISKVEKKFTNQVKAYALTLQERGGESETIKGSDIGVDFNALEQLKGLKKKQNGFMWLFKLGGKKEYDLDKVYTYDEAKLKNKITELKCLDDKHQMVPENASVVYEKECFIIKAGDKGNLIKQDVLLTNLEEVIKHAGKEIDLDEAACYEEATYQVDSKEIVNLEKTFNAYLKSEVTYTIGDNTETITKEQIKDWLCADDKMQPQLDRKQVEGYIDTLANKYDTVGGTRHFNTSSGTTVEVSGGDYGWKIDRDKETHELVKALKGFEPVKRTPICTQQGVAYGLANDIGGTYVEINLSSQYLWLYNNGKKVTEGSIVSGTADGRHNTPPGVYKIDYMERNATLKGPGYVCPVSFWMPFNEDIGLHDATWRGSFGGTIYKYNGSHGCINCPYGLVETIFNTVSSGTPVVCYH
ncbi:L,D-transpeptidase family protein [Cellulosilyticum ruminicola]|uniref:L,D-transpeptidase family protein n=1 Tax=Cellulosilyticum ruminicola TaxID=425254 RepID=UPI0006CFD1C4|nr:peptidoglycan binding domain-containing protein [Cellulosilyticum ruminicola]